MELKDEKRSLSAEDNDLNDFINFGLLMLTNFKEFYHRAENEAKAIGFDI